MPATNSTEFGAVPPRERLRALLTVWGELERDEMRRTGNVAAVYRKEALGLLVPLTLRAVAETLLEDER